VIERRTVFKAALAASAATVAAACTSGGDDGAQGSGGATTAPAAPAAVITAEPAVNAKDVPVLQPVTVRVAQGTLTEVQLTNPDGKAVEGALSDDKTSWTSSESLGYDKTYTYNATATGSDGKPVTLTGSFSTLKPASTVRVTLNPADDVTVGVAMPVSVKFTRAVKNKAAVEQALKIETSTEVEGSWGWLSDQQVDWRPKEYWPANTTVKVEAKLYGTDLGGGAYPRADVTTEFKIGRNQVVKIHTPDHKMNVYRGGSLSKSYPCSNGKDSDVNLNTPNGTYIIMTKEPSAIFDNARYGYTNVNKKWACRFSNHGEFIHENQDNAANIGKANTSRRTTSTRP
jgi:lipoprotein-anchoring transpeptidase ErfK/SrfK